MVHGSIAPRLQLFVAVMAELLLTFWKVSSTLMSVWHRASLQHGIRTEGESLSSKP